MQLCSFEKGVREEERGVRREGSLYPHASSLSSRQGPTPVVMKSRWSIRMAIVR